jgi:hypothetical protein
MKHTNKYAIQALKNEYADYPRNEWHYDRQYRMIVDALEMASGFKSLGIRDFEKAMDYLENSFNPNVENTIILSEDAYKLMKEYQRDIALNRYKPDHNRPRPNKGITPQCNHERRIGMYYYPRVDDYGLLVKPLPLAMNEWVAVPLATGLDNIN